MTRWLVWFGLLGSAANALSPFRRVVSSQRGYVQTAQRQMVFDYRRSRFARRRRPHHSQAGKSCFYSVLVAGLIPRIGRPRSVGGQNNGRYIHVRRKLLALWIVRSDSWVRGRPEFIVHTSKSRFPSACFACSGQALALLVRTRGLRDDMASLCFPIRYTLCHSGPRGAAKRRAGA